MDGALVFSFVRRNEAMRWDDDRSRRILAKTIQIVLNFRVLFQEPENFLSDRLMISPGGDRPMRGDPAPSRV
jgi:hypothetical protein